MIQQVYPEPTVGGMIFNSREELLLIKSHKWNDIYTIPGGHVEVGESLEEALRREVKEETGLDVFKVEFLCFHEFIADPMFWEERHFIFFDFVCQTSSESVTLNDEAEDYLWVPVREALQLPIGKYLSESLELYLARNDGTPDDQA